MQIHHKPTKILIVGKSGSGKSTYQLRYVKNSNFTRYFIFDHKLEFAERLGVAPVFSLDDLTEKLKAGEKYLSYHHSDEYPGDGEGAFQDFCDYCYEISKAIESTGNGSAGNSLFICDEVNRFTSTSDLGDGFKVLIEDGRLQGLDFIGTSHAANQISNRLRLQLSEIVALKTVDSRPLNFLEESGFDPEEVKALPVGTYICKDCDHDVFHRGKLFSLTNSPDNDTGHEDDSSSPPNQTEPTAPVEEDTHAIPEETRHD